MVPAAPLPEGAAGTAPVCPEQGVFHMTENVRDELQALEEDLVAVHRRIDRELAEIHRLLLECAHELEALESEVRELRRS